jgi:tRNA-Thr(GGU) m(6)t(6)A37 methyltransferase TsaA
LSPRYHYRDLLHISYYPKYNGQSRDRMKNEITFTPIGVIHSPFEVPEGTPIQPTAARDVEGTVEVFPEYVDGLEDLAGFSHIYLLYHFHLTAGYSLQVIPFMDREARGVFATRAPRRPNPIGISVVRLDAVEGNILRIRDVDIVDGTPLLDIKPYAPPFDCRGRIDEQLGRKAESGTGDEDDNDEVRIGWLRNRVKRMRRARDDGRFT